MINRKEFLQRSSLLLLGMALPVRKLLALIPPPVETIFFMRIVEGPVEVVQVTPQEQLVSFPALILTLDNAPGDRVCTLCHCRFDQHPSRCTVTDLSPLREICEATNHLTRRYLPALMRAVYHGEDSPLLTHPHLTRTRWAWHHPTTK